ncbi:MAG: PepSY-like domain-containing protein [Bacteroidetes bacterium]|nr:PepSY-like domain-containing protein [Bacteroidota bacterium]MBL6943903.1 PepSY-like domain-containing protein [Bacteroidales bacterium]
MKKVMIFSGLIMLAVSFYGQGNKSYRQLIETNNVPKEVRNNFNLRYPKSFVKMWYITNITYWYEDYGPSYYNGWYQPRTVVVYKFNEPSNYEVEFLYNDENSRAIFNRYGHWYETRTHIVRLPEAILSALKKSSFASWKISDYKERIEAPGMIGSVYRMQVSKNQLSSIIRINDDGDIVQIKTE